MPPKFLRHAEPWLTRSARDLIAAQQLTNSADPLYDAAVFHAQQAVEKALKGFLTAHGCRSRRRMR
jgi:HEPN domain-containing protein